MYVQWNIWSVPFKLSVLQFETCLLFFNLNLFLTVAWKLVFVFFQGQQPVEFNHAINYVNKIKVRNDLCGIILTFGIDRLFECIYSCSCFMYMYLFYFNLCCSFRTGSKDSQTSTKLFWKFFIPIKRNRRTSRRLLCREHHFLNRRLINSTCK